MLQAVLDVLEEQCVEMFVAYFEILSAELVSDNSGNSPQMAAPRRSREIDQSTQRFHVSCDNRCLLGNEYGGLHECEFLGRTLIFPG